MYGKRDKALDEEQQLLLDDNSRIQAEYFGGLPPTSMACSNCFQPYDLEEITPYQLLCDHSGKRVFSLTIYSLQAMSEELPQEQVSIHMHDRFCCRSSART